MPGQQGEAIALKTETGTSQEQGTDRERGSITLYLDILHLSPLPDHIYIINSLGWDGMCLSLFSKYF